MTIEDHRSIELAGLVRNISKNLEELVSKVQLKSNVYLDEIKSIRTRFTFIDENMETIKNELFEKIEQLENRLTSLEESVKITYEAGIKLENEFKDHVSDHLPDVRKT